jgi:hypothetical protein
MLDEIEILLYKNGQNLHVMAQSRPMMDKIVF